MLVTVSGISMLVNLAQFKNASSPIVFTELRSVIYSIDPHPAKAFVPIVFVFVTVMDFKDSGTALDGDVTGEPKITPKYGQLMVVLREPTKGIVMFSILSQPFKIEGSNVLIVVGISIVFKPLQYANASVLISVTPSGIFTLVRFKQYVKAESLIDNKFSGS